MTFPFADRLALSLRCSDRAGQTASLRLRQSVALVCADAAGNVCRISLSFTASITGRGTGILTEPVVILYRCKRGHQCVQIFILAARGGKILVTEVVGNADRSKGLPLHAVDKLFQPLNIVSVFGVIPVLFVVRNAGNTGNGTDLQSL